MSDQSAPIYNDRNIGVTSIQTAFLVDALLGQGGFGSMGYGAKALAAKILSDHPAIIAHPDFEPETVRRAIRDTAGRGEKIDKLGYAASDEELSARPSNSSKNASRCAARWRASSWTQPDSSVCNGDSKMDDISPGRGRPLRAADERRTHLMQIRWTEDEFAWITEERFKRQLESRSDLIRELVRQGKSGLLDASVAMMAIADPDGECTDIWAKDMRAAIAKAKGE